MPHRPLGLHVSTNEQCLGYAPSDLLQSSSPPHLFVSENCGKTHLSFPKKKTHYYHDSIPSIPLNPSCLQGLSVLLPTCLSCLLLCLSLCSLMAVSASARKPLPLLRSPCPSHHQVHHHHVPEHSPLSQLVYEAFVPRRPGLHFPTSFLSSPNTLLSSHS